MMNIKTTLLLLTVGFFGICTAQTSDSLRKSLENNQNKIDIAVEKLNSKGQVPPKEYNVQDFKRTMDPVSGSVLVQNIVKINSEIKSGKYNPLKPISLFKNGNLISSGKISNPLWVERGPYNVGGRTRAILFAPNDTTGKKVFAGGVSGGLWVNADITNVASEWKPIGDFWANTSIVCIAADPNNANVMYVGTGEVSTYDNVGSGIWKTSDGGTTWNRIFSTAESYNSQGIRNGNFYINDIKVRNNSGVSEVYVGVSGGYNEGFHGLYQAGLYKSTDGGVSFNKISSLSLPEASFIGYSIQQIEIGADNSIWVSTRTSMFGGTTSGGKIFKSIDGNTFTNVYDAILPESRVQIALSKQSGSVAYALLQGNDDSGEPVRIIKSTDAGNSWIGTNVIGSGMTLPNPSDSGIPDNDFTRGQHYYDLVIAVDPANHNNVYVGGIDLYKSIDAANTWTQISKWSNNNDMASLAVSEVHADQHAIVFNPRNPNQILFGNDGGIYFAANKNILNGDTSIVPRNTRYNTTQFYTGKLNPLRNADNEEMILGAQDNGTQMLHGAPRADKFYNSDEYFGGDGGICDYDEQELYQINSYVNNNHYIYAIVPNQFVAMFEEPDSDLGHFINEAVLDRNKDVFYSYRTKTDTNEILINRVKGLKSNPLILDKSTISLGIYADTDVSFLSVSPYVKTSTELYVGMQNGMLLKITNADTTPTVTQMATPFAGSISDIQFGLNAKEIIVTLSNYNTVSVYHTTDGGISWLNKENDLPDMPVRTALMNPENNNEVLLGTEIGVWGTTNFQSGTPIWAYYSKGLANTRVTELDYRFSDKTVLATTYGRGAFTTTNTVLSTNESNHKNMNRVYPNPTRGDLYLKFNDMEFKNVKVNIYDGSGKLVFSKDKVKADEKIVHGLPKGAYILKAESNGSNVVTSTVIIR